MAGVFPPLRTGAIAQAPLAREVRQAAEIVTFLDGSEQSYRSALPRQRWTIRLDLLADAEVAVLRAFFEQQKGRWGTFTFTDPWTGSAFDQCSFAMDTFPQVQTGENRNAVQFVIYEHA